MRSNPTAAMVIPMISGKLRTYAELIKLPTFDDRFEYLQLGGKVGFHTFGYDRYLNQDFYQKSDEWKAVRNFVIARDLGCDLAMPDRPLEKYINVHHMNPLAVEDFLEHSDFLLNPDFLICTSDRTHKGIHYGTLDSVMRDPIERSPYDTCPWRKPEQGD